MPPAQISLTEFSASSTIGAVYIGTIITTLLFGITCAQTYHYFTHYTEDKLIIKASVAALWALDTVHGAFVCHGIYHYCVESYANPFALLYVPWTLVTQVLVGTFSGTLVRLFYCHRTWELSGRNNLLGGVLLFGIFVAFVTGVVAFVKMIENLEASVILSHDQWAIYLVLSCIAAVDVMVAASLCVLMGRNKKGLQRTKSIFRSLMLYTINTSLLTCGVSVACVISFATMPSSGNLIFLAFDFVIPVLYVNSALAFLNSRDKIRRGLNTANIMSIPLSDMSTHSASISRSTETSGFSAKIPTIATEVLNNPKFH